MASEHDISSDRPTVQTLCPSPPIQRSAATHYPEPPSSRAGLLVAALTALLVFSPRASAEDATGPTKAPASDAPTTERRPPSTDAPDPEAPNGDPPDSAAPNEQRPDLLVTVAADLKYGFWRESEVTRGDMVIRDESETSELARVGLEAFFGGMPVRESRFTLGALLQAGVLASNEFAFPWPGAAALVGATVGPAERRNFSFVLAGVGAQGIPALTPAVPAAYLRVGTSVDGMVIAAGVDVAALEGVSLYLFGIELGWGRYFGL